MRKVSPRDCVIAVALPLEKEDFKKALQPDCPRDFAKIQRAKFPILTAEAVWRNNYQKFAHAVLDCLNDVRQKGVTVITEFSFNQISVLADFEVITLITHWTGSTLRSADIVKPKLMLQQVIQATDDVSTYLREQCSTTQLLEWQNWLNENMPERAVSELVSILNTILPQSTFCNRFGEKFGLRNQGLSATYVAYFNRLLLEEYFTGSIAEGNRVELFDNLYRVNQIVEQIPVRYSGIFDLTICNSVLLQDSLKNRCNNSLVIANRDETELLFRVFFYRKLIDMLYQRSRPYSEAYSSLRLELQKLYTA